ncbi:C40 family peptidase [Methylovulum sp.]|uniref:C40 family peptidase n=1 Tax=Methylovulum sp. TaxID=1916980 RepID=UPI00262A4FCD|nr:C40 family peptidase [Methylovulum sp.]MDD5126475.1 C40 family peptidase [Methylovulum sp.]
MPEKKMMFFLQLWLVLLSILIVGCASTPDVPVSAPNAGTASKPLLAYALSLQGKPYRYGKDTPEEGFDCSGFVRHVYQRQGILLPRTSREMAAILPAIPINTVQPGDLVFFNIDGKVFSHVGIYINDDDFIHAPSQRTGKVTISNLKNNYWQKRFMGVRRPYLNRAAN